MNTAPHGRRRSLSARTLTECRRRDSLRRLLGLAIRGGAGRLPGGVRWIELRRYADAGATIVQLLFDASPPDFTRAPAWLKPLFET